MVSSLLHMPIYSKQSSSPFRARQERLRVLLEARGVPLILVTHLPNIHYLTGFTGSAGIALVGSRTANLWVDPRYTLQAREQAEGVEVFEEKDGILKGAASWLQKNGVREAVFEDSALTVAQFELLRKEAGGCLGLKPAGGLLRNSAWSKTWGRLKLSAAQER